MATYIIPQVTVFQDFNVAPVSNANPLRAHITGAHAQLIRFSDEDERQKGELDYYDDLVDQDFDWPNRPAGGVVDETYVKLFVKDALLKYFEDSSAGGSTIVKTAGYKNRITSDAVNFKTVGAYARDANLFDRDVQLGDVAKVRFPGANVTLWTYIVGFQGDLVAAAVATPTIDVDNADNGGATTTVEQIAGPFNAVEATASAASYNPYPTGQVHETYTVIVTSSSVNGDLTTARLRMISASGLDDIEGVVPAAAASPTALGTHGATITFSDTGGSVASESAVDQGVSPDDLIAGQRWEVAVTATFTATPVPTKNSTYTGAVDTTYIVEVTKGNKFATGPAQISVSTTTGIDISGPTNVTAAATPVAIGTKGTTMTFAGAGLALGDKFYVTVTAKTTGPLRTLLLGHNIDEDVTDGDACELTLFIRKPELEVGKNRTGFAPLTNWETSATQFSVKEGIIAYDETWTDGGTPLPLDLISESSLGYGRLYVEYRCWLQTLCNEVNKIDDVGLINDAISGPLHPDNPLKWGVFKALSNSNGTEVGFTSVCDPDDVDSWVNVLERLLGRDDVYGLVPLTRDRTIQDLWAAHADAQSQPEEGLWRVAWFNLTGLATIPIVHAGSTVPGHTEATTDDGLVCLAVVEDDPNTTGSQFTILRNASGNGQFLTNKVRAGDIVRLLFTGDGFGNYTYSEYVVDAIESENQIRLLTGPGSAINTAAKVEIWRNLTATEEANEIATQAGTWSNRRVRAVWPDYIETSGTIQDGYHLCAALAGLSSGILPHQGMTHLEVAGFSSVPRTNAKFNKPQLDIMAGSGVWIVTQDLTVDGTLGAIYNRHAVTTGAYDDINAREEMLTRNVDSISYRFKDQFAPYIGVTNVTPSLIELLRLDIISLVDVLKNEKFTPLLGGQLIDATIIDLRPHAILRDHIVLNLRIFPPYPFNNFDVHLII